MLKTFHIATFGCQMNLADSSSLVAALESRGWCRVTIESEAGLLIFNTCSVRQKAEERVFGRLGECTRLKKINPKLKIAVVGCMAQRLGDELAEEFRQVDYVLGTDRLFELPDLLEGRESEAQVMTAFGHEDMDAIQPVKESAYSGFVTIARGCDNYCSYCIVPYVRGRERAHSVAHVVKAVRRMVAEGVVEICLLGQNVNSYQHEGVAFPQLLKSVLDETEIQRLRFMTSHPKDLSPDLVELMAGEPRLMPHIHLPLQSGSDNVLKAMGRNYTFDHYFSIVELIRSRLAYVSLTTDLMVGFPGESEADYEATLAAVDKVKFDAAFMFRYSVRPGTKAAGLIDDVPEAEKIARLNRLIKLQNQMSLKANQREVAQIRNGLVEGYSRRSRDFGRARTESNKIVLFPTDHPDEGQVIPLRIIEADAYTLHGEKVEVS